jgi:hypothetical protein
MSISPKAEIPAIIIVAAVKTKKRKPYLFQLTKREKKTGTCEYTLLPIPAGLCIP